MKAKQWIIVAGIVIAVMFFGMYSYILGFQEGDPAIDALASDAELLDDELTNLSKEALTGLEDLNNQVGFVEYSLSSLDFESQTIVITVQFNALRDDGRGPMFVGRVGSDPTDAVQAEYVPEGFWIGQRLYSGYSAQLTIPLYDWSRIYYGSVPEYDADESPVILSIFPAKEISDLSSGEGAES